MHFIPIEAQRILPISGGRHLWLVNHSYLYRIFNRRASHFLYGIRGIVNEAARESFAETGIREMKKIAKIARSIKAPVLFVIHPYYKAGTWDNYQKESGWHHKLGHDIARAVGIPTIDLLDSLKKEGSIKELRKDIIHPNVIGHAAIADALFGHIHETLAYTAGNED